MRELADFLTARYAEDEEVARAAAGPHAGGTVWVELGPEHPGAVEDDVGQIVTDDTTMPEHAAHIVRHDPARVLREIEAKQKIMEIHNARDSWGMCISCPRDQDGSMYIGIDECPILHALALPYALHPDYRDEWRP